MSSLHILLAEDDSAARSSLAYILRHAGYDVTDVATGEEALRCLEDQPVDIVLSDIYMHEVDGIEVLRAAQRHANPPLVILLTGYATLDTALEALRAGAFDYLLKPYRPQDLLRCIAAAATRRTEQQRYQHALHAVAQSLEVLLNRSVAATASAEKAHELLPRAGLQIDSYRQSVFCDGRAVSLTATEFALLRCLAADAGQVLDYATIVERVYGYRTDRPTAHSLIKSHIANLRHKVGTRYLTTVRGVGYLLTLQKERTNEQMNK